VLLLVAWPASAQDTSRGEFSAGWRYYHATIRSVVLPIQMPRPNDYPQGWYADASVNLSPLFAIVGEAGGTYFHDEISMPGTVSIAESTKVTFHTFMGGVRVRAPQIPWFVPFGQVVFGGERDASSNERTITFPAGNPSRSRREVATSNPVLGLDAGVTIAGGVMGVRVSAGYVRFFRSADADALRVNVGAVVRF
jgi:hypothetical protein